MTDFTSELAVFSAGLSFDDIPSEIVEKTKLCVLDYIANVYGSLELRAVRNVAGYIRSIGDPEVSSALGCGFRTSVNYAAFMNGVLAEAIEAQDGLRFGGNHPVSAVTPAAFAVGESLGASGRGFLEAVVAGYEVANRIAACVHPWHTLSGFLPTGTCGSFGAAASASRLFALDAYETLNALGNVGYLAPMSMAEELMGGYTIKIVQGGQAATVGIGAAWLATTGLTGHPKVLEGSELKGGFTQITVRAEPHLERLTEGLGEHYTLADVYFKPYTACRHTHGAAQGTLELVRREGIKPGDVASVKVFTYGVGVLATGKGIPPGGTFVSAQFSIPYVVAACLTDGELGPSQLTEERIADASLLELAGRVTVEADEGLNELYPDKTASRVEITLRDGRQVEELVEIPKGDPRDPMLAGDISEKVRSYSGGSRADVEAVIEMVLDLEGLDDIGKLAALV